MIALGNRRPFVAQPAWRPATVGHVALGQYDGISTQAVLAYKASAGDAQETAARLQRITPDMDWADRMAQETRNISVRMDEVMKIIWGRTGNPDAEERLLNAWGDLNIVVQRMLKNAPSILEMAYGETVRFFQDFWDGAKGAAQDFSSWALRQAEGTLEDYHAAVQALNSYRNALNQARAAGASPWEVSEAEAAVADAEADIRQIREVYRLASGGGSIDDVAQDVFGPYGASMGVAPLVLWGFAVAAALAVLTVLVDKLLVKIDQVPEFMKRAFEGVGQAAKDAIKSVLPSIDEHSNLSVGLIAGGGLLLILGRGLPFGIGDIAAIGGLGMAGYGTYLYFTEVPKSQAQPKEPVVDLLPGETAASYA